MRKAVVMNGAFSVGDFSLNPIADPPSIPQATLSSPINLVANTLQNWYGASRSVMLTGSVVPLSVGISFIPFPVAFMLRSPSASTQFLVGTTNTTPTGTYQATVTGTINIYSHSQQFNLTVIPSSGPPVLSATGAICVTSTPPSRQINLTWSTAIANPALSYRLDRSSNNFGSYNSFTINSGNWSNFCTPQSAPGSCTCQDLGGAAGPSCNSGPGVPALAGPAGTVYSYRIVATDPFGSSTSPQLDIPAPDCAPGFNSVGSATSTITSWCGSGVSTPPPGVTGAINWSYCDPDDPTWPNCASGQTQPNNPPPPSDPQSGFCVQISDDATFADAAFSGGTAGCGVAHTCGVIGAGSGCVSGALAGTAPSCSFGTPVSCMPGGSSPNNLLYNHQYFYRTKVEDTNAWGGQSGGGGGGSSGLPSGQLAYWKLNESSGTSFADSSGNGFNGACTGTGCATMAGVSGAPVLGGLAANFDGTDSITTTKGISVRGLAQVSVSLWFKSNVLDRAAHMLFEESVGLAGGGNTPRFMLGIAGSTNRLFFQGRSPDTAAMTAWVNSACSTVTT